MSMICYLLSLSPAQMNALRATPTLARDLAGTAQDDAHAAQMSAVRNKTSPELRAEFDERDRAFAERPEIKALNAEAASARERIKSLGPIDAALCLEKSWHMLYYLMNGSIIPVGGPEDVLMTGEDIGDDLAYGPPWWNGPDAVQSFAAFLSSVEGVQLAECLDLREMDEAQVYGIPIGPRPEDEVPSLRTEVVHFFGLLRDYVRSAASKGNGLLTWIA